MILLRRLAPVARRATFATAATATAAATAASTSCFEVDLDKAVADSLKKGLLQAMSTGVAATCTVLPQALKAISNDALQVPGRSSHVGDDCWQAVSQCDRRRKAVQRFNYADDAGR